MGKVKGLIFLGLTAIRTADVLDLLYHDFPHIYVELTTALREKKTKAAIAKSKGKFLAF